MKRLMLFVLILALVSTVAFAHDEKAEAAQKRDKIDTMSNETIERLFDQAVKAKSLYDQAYGYAVFSSMKFALGVSGGGGTGVAVHSASGDRTYMKMGTAGIGLGLGGRKYRIIFLFEDQRSFDRFVDKGWQADTTANATAGTDGATAESTFSNGLKIYQLSDKGLMAHAEVAGTKYWKNDKLN